jgi:hypothetical protein
MMEQTNTTIRMARIAPAFVATLLITTVAAGQSWTERAGQMTRTKISEAEAKKRSDQGERDRRNKISMRRMKPAMPGHDWNTDPTAIPYVHYQINKRTDLPVFIDNEGLEPSTDELFEYTVVYMTGHKRFTFNEREVENLARFLQRGGTMLLDDCYNRGSPFADSVRPEMAKILPAAEPTMLLKDDERVSDVFKMIYDTPWPGEAAEFENRPWTYWTLDDRPAVFFSPNDEGCAWEVSTPPSASNPIGEGIGHGGANPQREIMYQWATNWILYVMTH